MGVAELSVVVDVHRQDYNNTMTSLSQWDCLCMYAAGIPATVV